MYAACLACSQNLLAMADHLHTVTSSLRFRVGYPIPRHAQYRDEIIRPTYGRRA